MTDYVSYKPDRWLYPLVPVNTEATILQVRAGTSGTWQDIDLPIQNYYAIKDLSATTGVTPTMQLWVLLPVLIQTALGSGTVTIDAQDASSTNDLGFDRIKFKWSGGVWQINALTSGFISSADLGLTSGTHTSDANGVILPKYTYKGAWHSHASWRGGGAVLKIRNSIADNEYSSDRHWEASVVSWGTQDVRAIQYVHLPSARIFTGKANDAHRATHASLAQGDPNAQLDHLFRAMQDPQALIVLQHDVTPELGVSANALTFEVVQLWEPWLDLRARVQEMGFAGDFWSFEIAVRIASGEYPL